MAQIIADRVLETTTTTSTGPLTLAGAVAGYQPFGAVCANGDTAYYAVWAVDGAGQPTGDWECGLGTWGTGGILTRTTVHAGTAGPSAVAFAAGTKRVALTATASYMNGVPFVLRRTVYASGTGTHVYHPNAKRAKAILVGGGGGGGGGGSAWNGQPGGGGGGGGETFEKELNHLIDTDYVIGSGGTAGLGGNTQTTGNDGSKTSFGGLVAFGGKGGFGEDTAYWQCLGGGIQRNYIFGAYLALALPYKEGSLVGGGGGFAITGNGCEGNAAGNPYRNKNAADTLGVGGGGPAGAAGGGYKGSGGGSSGYGKGGAGGSYTTVPGVGQQGTGYGSGGGGGTSGKTSGAENGANGAAGKDGVLIIEEYA